MPEIARENLIRIPRRVFADRETAPIQVPEILNWMEQNPKELNGYLNDFDRVIQCFNIRSTQNVDQSHYNFHLVKGILDGQSLPTVKQLLAEDGIGPARRYRDVIENISAMMYRGQLPEDERVEPWVAYHTTNATEPDPRKREKFLTNLVIASIFHTYEEVVKARPEFADKEFESDRIIEALMETAAICQKEPLFEALAARDGMNWVDGYDRFTPEFRHRHGFN